MQTFDDVVRLVATLPGVTEGVEKHRGLRTWEVNGAGFAWERPFSKADIKRFGDAGPPAGPILAIRTADLAEKEAVLGSSTAAFFDIPHFSGYAAYLVQLDLVSEEELREALVDAWLAKAPRELAEEYLKKLSERMLLSLTADRHVYGVQNMRQSCSIYKTIDTVAGMAEVYTHGHHESVLRSHRWRTAENSAGYLLPELKPHMKILDVGCGPGTITADLADRVPEGHVTGIDSAAEIIAQARELAAGRENLDFTTGDVYDLDYPDATFCVVHAHQVLQHLSDPVRALAEMRRVTKPGGLVAARDSDYGAMLWYPRNPVLDEWLALYQAVARGNGGEPDAGRRLHVWAKAAGFTDVTVSSSTWTFATPQERQWWGGLWADRLVTSAFAASATGNGHATEDDLERIADGWRAWAADADGWFVVVHGEIRCRV